MPKSVILLFCLSLIGISVIPVAQAQNARSNIIIRGVSPDVRGRSYYNRRSNHRYNSNYYRPSQGNVIINIYPDRGDYYRYDNPYRYYRRGGGQTFDRNAIPQREGIYQQDRSNY